MPFCYTWCQISSNVSKTVLSQQKRSLYNYIDSIYVMYTRFVIYYLIYHKWFFFNCIPNCIYTMLCTADSFFRQILTIYHWLRSMMAVFCSSKMFLCLSWLQDNHFNIEKLYSQWIYLSYTLYVVFCLIFCCKVY